MSEHENQFRTSRRSMLSAIAGTTVAVAVGAGASNRATTAAAAADSIDELLLGTFESTLEGWETDGDLSLSRVGRDDRPIAVTEGEYALEAAVNGDPEPTIRRPISDLELSAHPYLVADVVPGRLEGTDAPIAFRFRLSRPASLLDGAWETIAESDPVTVPQATPGQLYWDASEVDVGLLDVASRLEIGWHPADREPESSADAFAYRGDVVFDAIRATDAVDPVGRARLAATMRDLQFDHGAYVRTEVTEEFEGGEAGTFVFSDGETEPYRLETVAADRLLLTVADAEIAFGGGWS